MQPTVGEIFEGKVTGITKFGAFVSMPDGKNGLVHISEIANTYVNDVHDYLSEGQTVKVKVVGSSGEGKVNLSIKKAEAPAVRPSPKFKRPDGSGGSAFTPRHSSPQEHVAPPAAPADASFEDKLKHFMQDSNNRISGSRVYNEKKSSSRRRRD